jgi:uncharacterized membrane protein
MGMFGNAFIGWHLLLVVGVLAVIVIVIVVVVALIMRAARRIDPERLRLLQEAEEQRARAERAERDSDGLV